MTNLQYLKDNAERIREFEDGKYTIYWLKEGIATYNNDNDKYLWYTNPQSARN